VAPWSFADRGWFVNDALNLRSSENLRAVAVALESPTLLFGVHRWFAGGSSPDLIAFGSAADWDAELARGRPGDNLIVLSVADVPDLVLLHAREPGFRGADVDLAALRLGGPGRELAIVSRQTSAAAHRATYRMVEVADHESWQDEVADALAASDETWIFDNDVVWRDHKRRSAGTTPPEQWPARHGRYVVDGFVPDAEGRIVCGGPY
jgi:hypothetical protein